MILLTLILHLVPVQWLHPFHVSVLEIEYAPQAKALQVSERVFLDDLEETLNKQYGVGIDIVNPENPSLRDSLIEDYITRNLTILFDGKKRKRTYLGHEIEKDAMWCYIEYYGVKKITRLTVRNTVFFDMFDDQNNLAHVTYLGQTKSKRMLKASPEQVFEF